MIIVKSTLHDSHSPEPYTRPSERGKAKSHFAYAEETEALAHNTDFEKYVKLHGYHFTDALAELASEMMENANGQAHTWTASQVKRSMDSLDLNVPSNITSGDVTYLANMYYADMYPDPLKDEASCLRAAYKIANDPDGYDGMIFRRWVSDIAGKALHIDWKNFI